MFKLIKFVAICSVLLSVLLLAANYLQSADGVGTEVQASAAQVMFMAHCVANEFPDNYASFSHSAGVFVRSNATTARLQFEGMKNAVPGSLAFLVSWIPASGSNLIHNGAQSAAASAASGAASSAKKIPVVNGAMNAADRHINALQQTISNGSLSF